MPISAKPGRATRPSTPSGVVGMPRRAARARPSEAGSMPTMAPISSTSDRRETLIIRSVPILPEPMMATLVRAIGLFLAEGEGRFAQAAEDGADRVAGLERHHRPQRAGQ